MPVCKHLSIKLIRWLQVRGCPGPVMDFSSFPYFWNILCVVNLKVLSLKAYTGLQALPSSDTSIIFYCVTGLCQIKVVDKWEISCNIFFCMVISFTQTEDKPEDGIPTQCMIQKDYCMKFLWLIQEAAITNGNVPIRKLPSCYNHVATLSAPSCRQVVAWL